ncbi:MAG TPA: UrcA family protein [Steroidobacteraceae bacterium]|nr:UrcA family protein [Steroidobacteraceae bacterium]
MRTLTLTAATVLIPCAFIGSLMAQTPPEVTVMSSRMTTSQTLEMPGPPSGGMPMMKISLSYNLSTAGFDLATPSGAQAFEKRIGEVAHAVCKEIGRQYPKSIPGDEECARDAAHRAMVQAHKLEKAAAQHSG